MKLHKVLKNKISTLVSSVLVTLALPALALAEEVSLFESDIYIYEDGSFGVTETIQYDFGSLERRGIYRDIEHNHPQEATAWYKERTIDVEVESVSRDGTSEPFLVTKEGDKTNVRIGDANKTITGKHKYTIHYHVDGGLSYFDDGTAEIYWDATGNKWGVPIEQAAARVWSEEGVLLSQRACYKGASGSNASCDLVKDIAGGSVFIATNLAPGEGLTVAQAVDASRVATNIVEHTNFIPFALAGTVAWLFILIIFVYRHHTKHKTGRTIIPQYEPYKGFKPMYTGIVFDGRLDPRDITAGFIYLAQQGFIKIKATQSKALWLFTVDDFEVELLRDPQEAENYFQKEILKLIFGNEAVGKKVKLREIKNSISKQSENKKIFKNLQKAVRKDLVESGIYERLSLKEAFSGSFLLAMMFLPLLAVTLSLFITEIFAVIMICFILSMVVLSFILRRRTRVGYEATDHLKGFKEFLSVTEKERYKFHNAPSKNPEQFMEFLPYAIAFGVEKEWAEVFKDVTIPAPEWYDAGASGAAFSAADFSSSIESFSSAFSSSTGSASSGGGSAGGGAGGGGGGSW